MRCPHCLVTVHAAYQNTPPFVAGGTHWITEYMSCPACKAALIKVRQNNATNSHWAVPKNQSPRPVPSEVPDPYKQDFEEATNVLALSAKASAALSRRSLQVILRDKAATTKKDLFDQIEEVVSSGKVPSHISEGLHAVRNIGNFAAHEIKSKATGQIVDVEPGEAEWNLDVLESLFDFYFVEPAKAAKRKADLNVKLKAAGKPEMP